MTDCIFCKIVSGEIPSKRVYENDYVIAIDDLHPKAKVHTLVIPKKHYCNLFDLDDDSLMAELLKAVKEVAKIKKMKAFKLKVNNAKEEGQEVFHLHMHVMSDSIEKEK